MINYPRGSNIKMGKLKRGYNWKARRNSLKHPNSPQDSDTNQMIIVPNTEKKVKDVAVTKTRNKLNPKHKKRLKKVLEAKEEKAMHKVLIQDLQKLALPKAELKLLTSTTSISRKRFTKKEIIEQKDKPMCLLDNEKTLPKRRKQRNRRKFKMEKILTEPKVEERANIEQDYESDSSVNSEIESDNDHTAHPIESVVHTADPVESVVHTADPIESVVHTAMPPEVNNSKHIETDETEETRESNFKVTCTEEQKSETPIRNVSVYRTKEIQTCRLELPIVSEEHSVMEAVLESDVVIICGETGSGKTTQVPQFLYEAGYAHQQQQMHHCMIGVTEPRRIAAITMSQRVAEEMSLSKKEVSYQIRYDGCVSDETRIKFMTDGVLLKEIEQDFLLLRYSVIIIDEAHERSVFTDILIGLLSRIVPQRRKMCSPLKVIVMSATLRVDDFTSNKRLFAIPPPVISVDSRQFPVTVHFNRHTPSDYIDAAYQKVCKIHKDLPAGHILVFVTGKAEVVSLCNRLKKTFVDKSRKSNISSELNENDYNGINDSNNDSNDEDVSLWIKNAKRKKRRNTQKTPKRFRPANKDINISLDSFPVVPQKDNYYDSSDDDIDNESSVMMNNSVDGCNHAVGPLLVYPLYSMLTPERQAEVFCKHSDEIRICVISTNVAETSVTIPGVKYVVDTGKVKMKHYDKITGASTYKINWISKASANQRGGRAGRTSPGHCYRLYSSSVFQHEFSEHTPPEITNRPVNDLVLQMKTMNIHKVINFPFPTPPSMKSLQAAEELLVQLGALEKDSKEITPLGYTLSHFPIAPRFSKMLCLSNQNGCLPYMIIIVAALSVPELFDSDNNREGTTINRRSLTGHGEYYLLGDLMVMLRAMCAYEYSIDKEMFCQQHGLRVKGINEVRKLRQQLTNIINTVCTGVNCCIDPKLTPPTQQQVKMLRQFVLSGHGDHVARKISTNEMNVEDKKKLKYAYETPLCDSPVFLHPSSVLRSTCPCYITYQELFETKKLFMRDVTVFEEEWLPTILPELCTFSSPLDTPSPCYDPVSDTVMCHMTSTFGSWSIPPLELPFPDSIDKYKYFAKFLLEGKVIKGLAQFTNYLLTPPIAMTKSWGKISKNTEVLLSSLFAKRVSNKASLLKVWTEDDPKFILAAFSKWLPESTHDSLLEIWPPIE